MSDLDGTITLEQYQKAYVDRKSKEVKIGFMVNLAAYIVVNSLLTSLNVLVFPDFYWFYFPLIGWGIGLTMHYVFGVRFLRQNLVKEQAEIERIART